MHGNPGCLFEHAAQPGLPGSFSWDKEASSWATQKAGMCCRKMTDLLRQLPTVASSISAVLWAKQSMQDDSSAQDCLSFFSAKQSFYDQVLISRRRCPSWYLTFFPQTKGHRNCQKSTKQQHLRGFPIGRSLIPTTPTRERSGRRVVSPSAPGSWKLGGIWAPKNLKKGNCHRNHIYIYDIWNMNIWWYTMIYIYMDNKAFYYSDICIYIHR